MSKKLMSILSVATILCVLLAVYILNAAATSPKFLEKESEGIKFIISDITQTITDKGENAVSFSLRMEALDEALDNFEMAAGLQLSIDPEFKSLIEDVVVSDKNDKMFIEAISEEALATLYIKFPAITVLSDEEIIIKTLPDYEVTYYDDKETGASYMSLFINMDNMPVVPRAITILSNDLEDELRCVAAGQTLNDELKYVSGEYRFILPDGFRLNETCTYKVDGTLTQTEPVVLSFDF